MSAVAVPRLLYLADVPVESTYHGSALVYRLLEDYPRERLRIVEGAAFPARHPERRLAGVAYATVPSANVRLLNSRAHRAYSTWLSLRAGGWATRAAALVADFRPEAVLTVAHGYLWVAAAELARARGLALHLIVHDDWPRIASLPAPFAGRVESQFGRAYRAAASRLCVSPYMAEEYLRRYGVQGDVLYPSRARGAMRHSTPVGPGSGRGIVFAFAGTLNTPDYWRLLRSLAASLAPREGRLLVYGPATPEQARGAGLAAPNVELRGLVRPEELTARLRAEADVLFVPMSFAASDRANMEMAFPSKLADYTAAGMPLLVWGPATCSAVRWAREHPGVAEVVDDGEGVGLGAALERLADAGHRARIAAAAAAAGDLCFSHEAAQRVFHAAIARGVAEAPGARQASA